MTKGDPFKYFKTSPEIIRLAVMMYVRFPLSLRNVEDLLHERGVDVSHETVRYAFRNITTLTNEAGVAYLVLGMSLITSGVIVSLASGFAYF